MILAADYPFMEIFWTMLIFFGWVAWIWMLVLILSDVFRSDMSGWAKAGWSAAMIFVPFLGVLIYLIVHGKDLGERRMRDAQTLSSAHQEHHAAASTNGAAAQIAEAKRLLDSGAIDETEYAQLKAKALR